jgi:hypothetical protein
VTQSVTTEQAAKGLKYTHRSYSQVRQLRTCGEQFRLERIERAPSKPSCPAVAGTAVHTGTETVDKLLHSESVVSLVKLADRRARLIEAALPPTMEALDAEIRHFEEKGWETSRWKRYGRKTKEKPNAEDIEWFRTVGIPKSIAAYVDWRLANPDFVLAEVPGFGPAIEVPFNYYSGDQLIHGFIDRIFTSKTAGGYYPVDLKSGLKPKTDEQLGVYSQALNKAFGLGHPLGLLPVRTEVRGSEAHSPNPDLVLDRREARPDLPAGDQDDRPADLHSQPRRSVLQLRGLRVVRVCTIGHLALGERESWIPATAGPGELTNATQRVVWWWQMAATPPVFLPDHSGLSQ